ncbi:TetR/AcrR family transcriptional regulator [Diplocloster modestus]|uniref:TetR/AcrR family transcriptional regulator n=1 Tax=Diplocloster modestus TaxID=2850322 RepID=A0ABS6KEC1_9FIRM|nr:TetR/AcrR family transcriptional regulator [Diplocloster modestus]MBU9728880.1 TetR/AcrR family transcriptional regulator [Diplocloster modestus]
MNQKYNRRFQDTEDRIENVFFTLLSQKPFSKITVRELCEKSGISRTSFYSHYEDIYELLRQVEKKVTLQAASFFNTGDSACSRKDSYIQLFCFIRENKPFFQSYFKNSDFQGSLFFLNTSHSFQREGFASSKRQQYRKAFFTGGFNALIREWLERGCSDSPEELVAVLEEEYGITEK